MGGHGKCWPSCAHNDIFSPWTLAPRVYIALIVGDLGGDVVPVKGFQGSALSL